MLYSALSSWFNFWIWPVLITGLLVVNFISVRMIYFDILVMLLALIIMPNKRIPYNIEKIKNNCTDGTILESSKRNLFNLIKQLEK